MSEKPPIPFPMAPQKALDLNPSLLVLYGQQKVGKTESVANLPGCLVIVLRAGSANHLSGSIMDIPTLCEQGKFGPFKADASEEERTRFYCDAYLRTLDELAKRRIDGQPVAPIVAHDDIGIIEDYVFDLALRTFRSTALGSSGKWTELKRITDLPGEKGSPGWAFVWEAFDNVLWRIRRSSNRSVVLAHMRDKMVNKDTGEVSDTDIDLSGKMRKILLREASATGFMYRERDGTLKVSFKNAAGFNVGAWCKHLVGQDVTLGTLNAARETVYDWSKIYVPESAPTPAIEAKG